MKKSIYTIILLFAISTFTTAQTTIQGVTLSPKIAPGKSSLVLNGAGIRTKYFLKLYVGGLYLKEKSNNAEAVVSADQHMAVRIHITSGILNSENMAEAIREGFEKSTQNNTEPFKKDIDDICSIFKSNPVVVGNLFEIYYVPGQGVRCNKNGKDQGLKIEGLAFKKALFGIWLSDDPVDSDLKEEMLNL